MKVKNRIVFIHTHEHFEACMGRRPKSTEELKHWSDLVTEMLGGSMIDEEDIYPDVREILRKE